MRHLGIAILLIIVMGGCSSKQEVSQGRVQQVESDLPTGHGLWYYLPKTVIEIEITAEKHVEKAGPFFRFAQRFLNITDIITENKEEWQIKGARISTSGIPDPQKLYQVSVSGMPSMAALNFTSGGVLTGVNMQSEVLVDRRKEQLPEPLISLEMLDFSDTPFTEEQMIRSSTTAMAEEVAKEIFRLREMRTNILEGDVDLLPPDEGAYAVVMDEIARQERAYLELFAGKRKTQQVTKVYRFIPEPDDLLNTILFRFSSQNGFLDEKDVSGTPVYIEVEVNENLRKNFLDDETEKSINTKGLVYCNPVSATVRVIDRTLMLSSEEVMLAQFGQLLRLPADLLDVPDVGVEMDSRTGAIKRIWYK